MFTSADDAKLLSLRSEGKSWHAIRMELPDRSRSSLERRWGRLYLRATAPVVCGKWTAKEVEFLTKSHQAHMPVKSIAEHLGRSTMSVAAQIKSMPGLEKPVRLGWKTDEDKLLLQMRSKGWPWHDVATALNRSYAACRHRYDDVLRYRDTTSP
ncbi:uncharacterized protein RCC_00422 [Ramularia collo-cygni]|uniref:Myb-like domain-containing protein n=1 Tax=Ramularia collo-cygni TaxID=112498 RepID=A0A2D3UP29_9PEZI|nr:uncharacterized protein RCC_00422 [Ramularia collo-cygni]CZT14445.1 uncharacterized protein RCC_00422 [Ramularia collo-cygni]